MKSSFTKLELKAQDGALFHQMKSEGEVLTKPDFIIPGLVHVSGSVETHDYICKDKEGNYFTFVPGDDKCKSFYVSTYEVSKDEKTGKAQSVSNASPWTNITFADAIEKAKELGGALLSNKQWERILRYIVETGFATREEMYQDSTMCGNYRNNPEGLHGHLAKTGSNTNWMYNGIDNFCGNTMCWVRNKNVDTGYAVHRGGSFYCNGKKYPASYSDSINSNIFVSVGVGFRVVLDRKHCKLK